MIRKVPKHMFAMYTVIHVIRSVSIVSFTIVIFVTLQGTYQYLKKWPERSISPSPPIYPKAPNKTYIVDELFKITVRNRTMAARKLLQEHGMRFNGSGVAKRVLVVTTWRSGSTFTGELLRAVPGTFYNYEPLIHMISDLDVRNEARALPVVEDLKKILQCDYLGLEEAFKLSKTILGTLVRYNTALSDICKGTNNSICLEKAAWSFACPHFPVQVTKIVRVPLRYTLPLLRDPELNLHIVLLVRDPRGVMASRLRAILWCRESCTSRERLCELMRDNYETALQASKEFPDSFMLLRYEDLALEPEKVASQLLKRLNLPNTAAVREFIETHTSVESVFSNTMRMRGSRISAWRGMPWNEINATQMACEDVLEKYGYISLPNDGLSDAETIDTSYTFGGDTS